MNVPPARPHAVSTMPANATPGRRAARFAAWLVLLLLLAAIGTRGWQWWHARDGGFDRDPAAQWQDVEARIDALRRDQRAQAQRIAQAEAGARILREEVLGVGQRTALLQDSFDQLAGPVREGAKALRLDEVESLLSQGAQRLLLAGDVDGARKAYALAAERLDGIQDPALLDLRQALAQERTVLSAPGADPRQAALARLDAFARRLAPPDASALAPRRTGDTSRHWWQRAFARLVQVQPSDRTVAASPGERAAGYAALQLELALARIAAERRDDTAWRGALGRARHWHARLWPASPATQARHAELERLQAMSLQVAVPGFGSTLRQLRAQRRAG